jgi:hypothetical protein
MDNKDIRVKFGTAVALLWFQRYEVLKNSSFWDRIKSINFTEVKMNKKTRRIVVLTVVAIFGITTLAFAGWGRGYGHMMGGGYGPMMGRGDWGPGQHHMGGYGYSQGGYYGNLSDEEIAKLDQQRSEFFNATETTRQRLYEKELALRSELAKENPDTSIASNLQSEISNLQSDLDQKRLDYEVKARKSVPNYNRGGRGYGSMMRNGYGGGGYCRW